MRHILYDTLVYIFMQSILYNDNVAEYLLKEGSIETNTDGEVVGATISYVHLLGEDISDVVRRKEARGIAKSYAEDRLPTVQKKQRNFRRYDSNLLRERKSTSRRRH